MCFNELFMSLSTTDAANVEYLIGSTWLYQNYTGRAFNNTVRSRLMYMILIYFSHTELLIGCLNG